MRDSKCKICRRLGEKLFLKGERCLSPKCSLVRRPYPPGQKRKRRTKALSEYGKELRTKQKLKNFYNLKERQFRKYVKEILEKRGKIEDPADSLIKKLETRFDNIIFRLGFAASRSQARQLISHGHFLVNEKPVNIPSFHLKKDDKIKIRHSSLKKGVFQNIALSLKEYQPPSWLKLDKKKLEGKVIALPSLKEISLAIEISPIFEYYSR